MDLPERRQGEDSRSLEMGGRKLADLHIHETTLEEIYRAISGRAPSPEMDKL